MRLPGLPVLVKTLPSPAPPFYLVQATVIRKSKYQVGRGSAKKPFALLDSRAESPTFSRISRARYQNFSASPLVRERGTKEYDSELLVSPWAGT